MSNPPSDTLSSAAQASAPRPLTAAERDQAIDLLERHQAYEQHQAQLLRTSTQLQSKAKTRRRVKWTVFWLAALACTTAVAQAHNLTHIPGMLTVLEWRSLLPVIPRMDVAAAVHLIAWWFCVAEQ